MMSLKMGKSSRTYFNVVDSIRELQASINAANAARTTTTLTTTPNGDTMATKFKPLDKVRHVRERWTGVILQYGMNSQAAEASKSNGYTVLRDDGITNGGTPEGYNAKTEELERILPVKLDTKKGGVDFDSVILSKDKKDQIEAAISQIDNHDLIFNKWGFGDVFEKGTAISLLFWGKPGTGKTLMAQAIADKYNYALTVISTAEIETPEPGGAERNLKKYFADAGTNSILLFDECDSLISNRTHVGMILAAQINALLTELEHFKGIAIFTTNRLEALDPAFDRRLSLKLEFPMPDAKHRLAIWKRMFPKQAPLDKNIRWEDLASIEVAGGHIKNVVLKAARMAAALKAKAITDEILWDCLEKEIESRDTMAEAIESRAGAYGTPLPNAGRGMSRDKDIVRTKGKRRV